MTTFRSKALTYGDLFPKLFIRLFNKGVKKMGFIKENNGAFELFDSGSAFVQAYSRKRDALRGATRRGIVLNG